jgi:uncharacterized cupredoxin-like copper-binding protein
MRSRLPILAIVALSVAAIAVLTAGCGDDDDTTASPTTTAAQDAGSNVDLSATDFKFSPADPSTKAGQVTFNVSNDGQTVHNLEVEGPNGEQELSSDLSAGQSGTLTVDMSKPGTYEFYCPVGDHRQLGMEGEITVK